MLLRSLLLAALVWFGLSTAAAYGQTRTYVIHNGPAAPGTTTFTPPRPVATPPPAHASPAPYRAQPGQKYEQIFYGDDNYLAAYRRVIRNYNPSLGYSDLDTIVRSILYYSHVCKVDPRFVVAVVANESRFRPHVTSSAGAQGLGQLMPATAASLGVDPHVPYQNLQGTVRYLKLMLDRFRHLDRNNQMRLALASYNAGYGAVTKYGGIPPYSETQNYVHVVMSEWRKLTGER